MKSLFDPLNISQVLKQYDLPHKAIIELSEKLRPIVIEKDQYFVRYGEKMNRIGILYKGILVSRYSSEEGEEIASKFYYLGGDTIVADYHCFKNQLPSDEEIQAIERADLLTLSCENYIYLLQKYPSFQKLVIESTEMSYLKALRRIRDFQLLNAENRVKKFVQKHVSIADKIMVKDKASYLGMSRNRYTESAKKI